MWDATWKPFQGLSAPFSQNRSTKFTFDFRIPPHPAVSALVVIGLSTHHHFIYVDVTGGLRRAMSLLVHSIRG